MPERLADSLVQKGLVSQHAANEAIDRLVLMGGALDTCLLELGLVDEETLIRALCEAYGTEAATLELLASAPDERAVRAFPEQWAKKHGLAPLEVVEEGLRVLSPAPADLDALRRLGELLDLKIVPVLAPEFRVQQRLATLYGTPPSERFQALLDRYGPAPRSLSPPRADSGPSAVGGLPSSLPGPSVIGRAGPSAEGLMADALPDEILAVVERLGEHEQDTSDLEGAAEHPPAPEAEGAGDDDPAARVVPVSDQGEAPPDAFPSSAPARPPADLAPDEEPEALDATARGEGPDDAAWGAPQPRDDGAWIAPQASDGDAAWGAPQPRDDGAWIAPQASDDDAAWGAPQPVDEEATGSPQLSDEGAPQGAALALERQWPPFPGAAAAGLEAVTARMTFAEGVASLRRGGSPDDVAATALAYAHQWLRFVALLRLEGATLKGWVGRGPQAAGVPAVSLDLDEESAFKVVADTRTHYLGPLPSDPAHGQFLSQLGRPPPRMVLLVPIRREARTVALLYADDAEAAISPRLVADLLLFFTHVQVELESHAREVESTPTIAPPSVAARRASAPTEPERPADPGPDPMVDLAMGLPAPTPILEPLESDKPVPVVGRAASPAPAESLPPPPASPLADDALSTLPDGRLEAAPPHSTRDPADAAWAGFDAPGPADPSAAFAPEGSEGYELLGPLDDEPSLGAAPHDSGGWASVDADNWDEWEPPAPESPEPVASMRASLREDATVPDLSAEAWIRASSELTRARPLSPDVVLRSELPDPEGIDQPVPLTRMTMIRRTVPVGEPEAAEPEPVIVAGDNEPDSDLLDLDEVMASPSALTNPQTVTALIEQLHGQDPLRQAEASDALARRGPSVLPAVMEHFPGPLDVDPFGPSVQLFAFSRCGPLLGVLERNGPDAHPYVMGCLEAPDPLKRFFAIYFYGAVYVPEAIPRLIQRLHDEEPRVCMLAARTLFSYRDHRDFSMVLDHLHGRLSASSLAARRHAAYLLGLLRDVTAIPKLIEILARGDRGVQKVVEDALGEITKQRLGGSAKRWRAWWTRNQSRSRIEWLLEGLASKHAELRQSASDELRAVTGMDLGYDGAAPRRQREEARQRWLKWWRARQARRSMSFA